MPRLLPILSLCVWFMSHSPLLAQDHGFIEHLEPPVLQRGKTTRVTAVGTHLTPPSDIWSSLPAGKFKARPVAGGKSAAFDVHVAADAPVGLFGLRVATPDGLSNVHLCLIDDLPASAAPDSGKAPARVTLPCALWGRFREAEVDRFAIEVKAGQRVSFELVGNRLGKEVDPLVTIRDAAGRFVAERDNDAGLYFDCRFEHRFAQAGTYTVEVRDARYQGHPHGHYVLRMGRFPAARVAVPATLSPGKRGKLHLPELAETLEAEVASTALPGPHSLPLRRATDEGSTWLPVEIGGLPAVVAAADATTAARGTQATLPAQLCGVLNDRGEGQFFRLALKQGQRVYLHGHGRSLNSPIDIDLAMTDDTGRVVHQANRSDEVQRIEFAAGKAGTYCLRVRDQGRDGSRACAYRIEARTSPPLPSVVAEVEGLTVPRGGYQSVPLVVQRNGYGGPIALKLIAPQGMTLSPSEIAAGANQLVCQLSAADAPLGLHTVQIWAEAGKGDPPAKTLVRTQPLVDRQLLNVDLIPYTLREDQHRLPPSVSDRLALQVTQAAPFTVELTAKQITLARYQKADIPIVTTRRAGFTAPITFTARGGQLADKEEGRTRVYAEFPSATASAAKIAGSVHSRILSNLGTTRIEVLATARDGARQITLIRTFDLEIRSAFTFVAAKGITRLAPGAKAKVQIRIHRVKTFGGLVMLQLTRGDGLRFAETVSIPPDKNSVEVEVQAEADAAGRRNIELLATADVDGFEEETRGRVELEVVPAAKKK